MTATMAARATTPALLSADEARFFICSRSLELPPLDRIRRLVWVADALKFEQRAEAIFEAAKSAMTDRSLEEGNLEPIREALGLAEAQLPADLFDRAREYAEKNTRFTGPAWDLDGLKDAYVQTFAQALAAALGSSYDQAPPPRDRTFQWMREGLTAAAMGDFLNAVLPEEMRAKSPLAALKTAGPAMKAQLSTAQAHALSLRIRDTNTAVFTEPTVELAARLAALHDRPLVGLPRVGTSPIQDSKYTWLPVRGVPESRLLSVAQAHVRSGTTAERNFGDSQHTIYSNRVGVGEYGPSVAFAIVEAVRIAMGQVRDVAEKLENSAAFAEVKTRITVQKSAAELLQEGVATIGQVLGLLLGKAVPGMDVDQLLEKISDGALINQVAMTAPFGVLGPLGNEGIIAADAITFTDDGRALLPRSVHNMLKEAHHRREPISAGSKIDAPIFNRTETMTGCPVALRGPVRTKDGSVELTEHPPLQQLASEVVALVRRVVREQGAGA